MASIADPITIPLSSYHKARLSLIDATVKQHETEIAHLRALKLEAAQALLGQQMPDVQDFPNWEVAWGAESIVCTPPAASAEQPSA